VPGSFRGRREQLELVKRAALAAGVTVSAYIKATVYKQAVADVQAAEAVWLR
jgi:uncharacterized protein (DUF1778 family)